MKHDVRFEYVPWKNVWFCFTSIGQFTSVIKLRNFDFESHWNTLIFLSKNNFRFEYVLPNSVWFGLSFVVWVKFWQ